MNTQTAELLEPPEITSDITTQMYLDLIAFVGEKGSKAWAGDANPYYFKEDLGMLGLISPNMVQSLIPTHKIGPVSENKMLGTFLASAPDDAIKYLLDTASQDEGVRSLVRLRTIPFQRLDQIAQINSPASIFLARKLLPETTGVDQVRLSDFLLRNDQTMDEEQAVNMLKNGSLSFVGEERRYGIKALQILYRSKNYEFSQEDKNILIPLFQNDAEIMKYVFYNDLVHGKSDYLNSASESENPNFITGLLNAISDGAENEDIIGLHENIKKAIKSGLDFSNPYTQDFSYPQQAAVRALVQYIKRSKDLSDDVRELVEKSVSFENETVRCLSPQIIEAIFDIDMRYAEKLLTKGLKKSKNLDRAEFLDTLGFFLEKDTTGRAEKLFNEYLTEVTQPEKSELYNANLTGLAGCLLRFSSTNFEKFYPFWQRYKNNDLLKEINNIAVYQAEYQGSDFTYSGKAVLFFLHEGLQSFSDFDTSHLIYHAQLLRDSVQMDDIKMKVNALSNSPDDVLFILSLIRSGSSNIENDLNYYHQLQQHARTANESKKTMYKISEESQLNFWLCKQQDMASIMNVSKNILEKIVTRAMGNKTGFYGLDQELSFFSLLAKNGTSEKMMNEYINATNTYPISRLIQYVRAFESSYIASMTPENVDDLIVFIESTGKLSLPVAYQLYQRLLNNEVVDDVVALGIISTGKEGADEFIRYINNCVKNLLEGNDRAMSAMNPIHLEIIKELAQADGPAWMPGDYRADVLQEVLDLKLTLPTGVRAAEYFIKATNMKGMDYDITDSSAVRFKAIVDSFSGMDMSGSIFGDWVRTDALRERKISLTQQLIKANSDLRIENSKTEFKNEKKIQSLEEKLIRLNQCSQSDEPEEYGGSLSRLLVTLKNEIGESHAIDLLLRKVVLFEYFQKNTTVLSDMEQVINSSPDFSNFQTLVEFITKNIKDFINTTPEYADVRRPIMKAFDIKALTDEVARLTKMIQQSGVEGVSFTPQLSVLGELSGYISQSCLRSQYRILANFPNLLPILINTTNDTGWSKPKGMFLLLEGVASDTKERALIIRGNNPRESFIRGLDPIDYVKKVVHYSKETAERLGIKRVFVVYDGVAIGSTNRPSVWVAYQELFNTAPSVELSGNIQLNDQDIRLSCRDITNFDADNIGVR